jgi:S1-C subfamily serine protease
VRLVIDHAAIAESERRRRGEAANESWWKRYAVWTVLAANVALAAAAAWCVVQRFASRPIGPLAALVADRTGANQRAVVIGGVAMASGVIALVWLRRRRHFRWVPGLVGHGLAVVLGTTALVLGAFGALAMHGNTWAHTSMPPRRQLDVAVQIERIVGATVVVLAPDASGDARLPAIGSGAIVAADEGRAWIVTCSHVAMPYAAVGAFRDARKAQPVWVQLSDGRGARATVRWTAAPPLDVALLELPIERPPEPVRVSFAGSELAAGSSVTFVPNPYRAGWLVHHGKLLHRAPHRTTAGTFDLLYTDLPVTHGDSGSGLFDAHGELIGLNTWTHGISLPSTAMRELLAAIESSTRE